MLVVVVEHEGADAQVFGGRGRRHQRRHRGELLAEVVGHRERRVAEVLDLAGQLDPPLGVVRRGDLDPEAERTRPRIPRLAHQLATLAGGVSHR